MVLTFKIQRDIVEMVFWRFQNGGAWFPVIRPLSGSLIDKHPLNNFCESIPKFGSLSSSGSLTLTDEDAVIFPGLPVGINVHLRLSFQSVFTRDDACFIHYMRFSDLLMHNQEETHSEHSIAWHLSQRVFAWHIFDPLSGPWPKTTAFKALVHYFE